MTADELNAAISEIIVAQEKPRSTGNSFFRKYQEKRRLYRLIPPIKLQNLDAEFFNAFAKIRPPARYWCYAYYNQLTFYGGIVYSSITGRFKLLKNCVPKKDVKNKRFMKKIQSRAPRRFNGKISDGAAFKRVPMKHPIFG